MFTRPVKWALWTGLDMFQAQSHKRTWPGAFVKLFFLFKPGHGELLTELGPKSSHT